MLVTVLRSTLHVLRYNIPMEKKRVVINDILTIYYCYNPKKASKTLLFLHGWRSNSTLWFSVVNPLVEREDYAIYCVDLPGFGESHLPKKPWKIQDYVNHVLSFIRKLNLDKVTLVGHSFGGSIGIVIASEHPDLLDTLVLVDSAGLRKVTVKRQTKKIIAKILKPIFMLSLFAPIRTRIYVLMGAEDYIATPELKQTYLNIVNENLSDYLPKIKTKTLLLWGQNDKDTPLHDAREMEKTIRNNKLIIIPDAGHYSFLDNPKKFLSELTNFLER